jgi:ZIP family zinc transporter
LSDHLTGAIWAFGWGIAAASGGLLGGVLGLRTRLGHRAIAAFMSLGAGVLLSAASFKVATEALVIAGALLTTGAVIAGAATYSVANAILASARDRKRCGECKTQLSEAQAPGSGSAIALGTGLDAVPEALVLGASLRAGGADLGLIVALALANVPEALSGTAGMKLASRSTGYVLKLWGWTTLGTATTTAVAFYFLHEVGPDATALLKAFGAGALISMTAETMFPEAFHNGPRLSGVLAASGFAALMLLNQLGM